jgi:hypothetical protein
MLAEDFKVSVHFELPRPQENPKDILDRTILALDKGLITKKRALRAIYPNMSEEELDELEGEVEDQNSIVEDHEDQMDTGNSDEQMDGTNT